MEWLGDLTRYPEDKIVDKPDGRGWYIHVGKIVGHDEREIARLVFANGTRTAQPLGIVYKIPHGDFDGKWYRLETSDLEMALSLSILCFEHYRSNKYG